MAWRRRVKDVKTHFFKNFAIKKKLSNEDFINFFKRTFFAAIFQFFHTTRIEKYKSSISIQKSIREREKFNCAQVQCHLCTLWAAKEYFIYCVCVCVRSEVEEDNYNCHKTVFTCWQWWEERRRKVIKFCKQFSM